MSNKPQSNSSFYLKTVLINNANSARYLDMIIIEDKLKNNAKSFISKQVRKLESIETDIRMMVGSHFANEIRKEISENWETLGIQSVNNSMMKMTNEQIAQLEKCCDDILNKPSPMANNTDEPSGHGGC